MARECAITGKKKVAGNNVSHSHRKTKRSFKPNLRRVRAVVDGQVKKIWVSTSALKAGLVERPTYSNTDAE